MTLRNSDVKSSAQSCLTPWPTGRTSVADHLHKVAGTFFKVRKPQSFIGDPWYAPMITFLLAHVTTDPQLHLCTFLGLRNLRRCPVMLLVSYVSVFRDKNTLPAICCSSQNNAN